MVPVPLPTPVPVPAPVPTSAPNRFKFGNNSDAPGTVFQHQFGGVAGARTFVDTSGGGITSQMEL